MSLVANRVIAIKDIKTLQKIQQQSRPYADSVDELQQYLEQHLRTGSDSFVSDIEEAYEVFSETTRELNTTLQGSNIRVHSIYPEIGDDARQKIQETYGETPESWVRESPDDFYHLISTDLADRSDVEWVTEETQINNIRDFYEASQEVEGRSRCEWVPNMEVSGIVAPEAFESLFNAYESSRDVLSDLTVIEEGDPELLLEQAPYRDNEQGQTPDEIQFVEASKL